MVKQFLLDYIKQIQLMKICVERLSNYPLTFVTIWAKLLDLNILVVIVVPSNNYFVVYWVLLKCI